MAARLSSVSLTMTTTVNRQRVHEHTAHTIKLHQYRNWCRVVLTPTPDGGLLYRNTFLTLPTKSTANNTLAIIQRGHARRTAVESCQDRNAHTRHTILIESSTVVKYLVESFAAQPTAPKVLVHCAGRQRVLHGL